MRSAIDDVMRTRSPLAAVAGWGGLAALFLACFGPVLLGGGQFAFRDAPHFYYPLHQRIQQEWRAGRLPLWDPSEGGGAPLLGNPVAAVLYPGKLIFAALPYPWAARIYTVAHVALAAAAMWAMLRSWDVSRTGAAIGAFSYAFAAPVLFQYCNVIYLVGAAWLPLGFRAADRWLRLRRRAAIVELAAVLAMQTLGGDLQAAYVLGICSGGYAIGLALARSGRSRAWPWLLGGLVVAVAWAVAAAALGDRLQVLRLGPARAAVAIAWAGALLFLMTRHRRGADRPAIAPMLLGLAASAALAIAVSAAQLVPVAENLAASARWDEEHFGGIEAFSLVPYRAVEWAWPNLFGSMIFGDRYWLPALPPGDEDRVWVPSLYFGVLPMVLALGAAGFRGGPPWRAWLTAVAIVGFAASCGKWLAPGAWLGRPGGDSLYQLLATALPGFGGFRYPSKLLVFVSLALSGLAAIGWDRALAGRGRTAAVASASLAALGLILLAGALASRTPILDAWKASAPGRGTIFGPFDLRGAYMDLLRSLAHGASASGLAWIVLVEARRRPGLAAPMAMAFVAADLALANAWLIFSIPRADLDREPEALRILRDDVRERPEAGPYRIHRMPRWAPIGWAASGPPDRPRALVNWERDSLGQNNGIPEGVEFSSAGASSLEREEFARFFRPYTMTIDARVAASIGGRPGQKVICYPRRAFDLWGTRYFVLPIDPGDWLQRNRGFLTFLDRTELIHPRAGSSAPRGPYPLDDVQIRRNLSAFPRAWTVHDAVLIPPSRPGAPLDPALRTLSRDGPGGAGLDPKTTAVIETDVPSTIAPSLSGAFPSPSEAPRITSRSPNRVEIDVALGSPGVVVLAELFDPGWRLSIDGRPAPILKTNGLMRGAAVGAGPHRLDYVYDPRSFRIGAPITAAGLVALVAVGLRARRG